MHCYACNLLLTDTTKSYDNKTKRHYCGTCFEPTEYEILRAKYLAWKKAHPDATEEITPEEFEVLKDRDEEAILEEYQNLIRQRERAMYLADEFVEEDIYHSEGF